MSMTQTFQVVIERDREGYLVASVPALRGCHTRAKSYDDLIARIQEAIALCLEDDPGAFDTDTEFVGLQQVAVER